MTDTPPLPPRIEPAVYKDLLFVLEFALRHKVRLPMVGPRKARWHSESDSRIAAQAIADHLVLANFRIAQGPIMEGWGQNFPGPSSSPDPVDGG